MSSKVSAKLYDSVVWPVRMLVLMWGIALIQHFTPLSFIRLGVYPGEIWGLKGIFFMPLVHGDLGHILSNTAPFFVLTNMVMFFYRKVAWASFLMIYLLSGLAVWMTGFAPVLFGQSSFHVGASGVIYGLAAFVFWTGIFRRNLKSIALALIVAFYYGSMIWGILPGQEGISWQGHLLGGLAGVLAAFWFKDKIEEDESPKKYSWEEEEEETSSLNEGSYFLNRDVFQKTKKERERERLEGRDSSDWFSSNTWD
jgi:membrane associated rhomboid family serine protease